MYLTPQQINDISQIKPANARGLEVDIYDAQLDDRQSTSDNGDVYIYLNRPLRKATDSRTGGLHLLNPTIETHDRIIQERPWNGQKRDGSFTEFGPQGWYYNRKNIPNVLSPLEKIKEHNKELDEYSKLEEKDRYMDRIRFSDRVHIVGWRDKIEDLQGKPGFQPKEFNLNFQTAIEDSLLNSDATVSKNIEPFTLMQNEKLRPNNHWDAFGPDYKISNPPKLGDFEFLENNLESKKHRSLITLLAIISLCSIIYYNVKY